MNDKILEVLSAQIEDAKKETTLQMRRLTTALIEARPVFIILLPTDLKDQTFSQKVMIQELKEPFVTRESLTEMIETASISMTDVKDFVFLAMMNTGLSQTTDTLEDFVLRRRDCKECVNCAMAYALVGLSAVAMIYPMDIDMAMKISHSPEGLGGETFEYLLTETDGL